MDRLDRYFLKGDWDDDWKEVTAEQYMRAEASAGFRSKFPGLPATAAFSGNGISGRIQYAQAKP